VLKGGPLNTMQAPAIELSDVTCIYRGKSNAALANVSLTLGFGQTVALIGPNGAGKSTLMKAIYGSVDLSAGEVKVLGKPLKDYVDVYKVIGFTSDENVYPATGRVKNVVAYEVVAQGLDRKIIGEVRESFQLTEFWNQRLRQLSTGQRQRVMIALAVLSDPPILLLDEPANGLDIDSLIWLYNLIRARENAGKLTIVSSHNLAELKEIASTVVLIKQSLRYQGDFFSQADAVEGLRARYLELVEDGN
jgi:ABC-2 type transport system ATP-binding protein